MYLDTTAEQASGDGCGDNDGDDLRADLNLEIPSDLSNR